MPRKEQLSRSAKRKLKEKREALAVTKRMPKITQWMHGSVHHEQPENFDDLHQQPDGKELFFHCCKHFKFLVLYKNALNKVIYDILIYE